MFIQVIQGRTTDAPALRRQVERWQRDVGPGARGYLGSTGGVAADGTVVLLARFEDAAAARANSDRPEQGAWWTETGPCFEGAVVFRDCAEVDTVPPGGSDDAGFVQVMQGRALDRPKLRALEERLMPILSERRPDVMGSIRAWDGDVFTDAIYFTSEADARKGEAAMADDAGAEMAEFGALVADLTFIDLPDPWLHSP
jgi:hypothetical protein